MEFERKDRTLHASLDKGYKVTSSCFIVDTVRYVNIWCTSKYLKTKGEITLRVELSSLAECFPRSVLFVLLCVLSYPGVVLLSELFSGHFPMEQKKQKTKWSNQWNVIIIQYPTLT